MTSLTQLVAAMLLAVMFAGCGAYQLRGRVVEGPRSEASVIGADDPRLAGPPIADATVRFILDPQSAGRKVLGQTVTDDSGNFVLPVDVLGAGTLEYELLVIARADKKAPAMSVVQVPSSGRRILVTLQPGRDRPVSDVDALDKINPYISD